VGSIDLATVGEYGSESGPRAYRFDGELNIANRGMIEFIEMLKADERFLYILLTLTQEKNIKTGRFSLIYADEFVIAHTNEAEFKEFLADKKSEALQDRMIMVQMPYNLKASAEVKIYEKLLKRASIGNIHMAPHALEVAAMFAVLSRLEEPKMAGLTIVKKMHRYDGQEVDGFRQKDVKLIKAQAEREGMDGISPRFVINCISSSMTPRPASSPSRIFLPSATAAAPCAPPLTA
jgi:serine protein kinase